MTPTERALAHKVLLVDYDHAVRSRMNATLEPRGFEVVAAASVTEALRRIATESFDALITGLNLPNPVAIAVRSRKQQPLNRTSPQALPRFRRRARRGLN
jgi:CheY-like chemotaxis protein